MTTLVFLSGCMRPKGISNTNDNQVIYSLITKCRTLIKFRLLFSNSVTLASTLSCLNMAWGGGILWSDHGMYGHKEKQIVTCHGVKGKNHYEIFLLLVGAEIIILCLKTCIHCLFYKECCILRVR